MERLKKWKEQKKVLKYTNQDIAIKSKLPLRTVEQIMCGKVKAPRLDTVEAIEKALGLDEDSLIKSIGGFQIPEDKYAIPLVGDVVCGKPIETAENLEGYVYIDYKNPEEYFALKVHGDSMINAGITPKSILIVHKQNYAESGDIIVACIDGESTIKRYHEKNGLVILMPENSAYSPIPVSDKNDFYIFGKVVQIRTDL